MGEYPDQAGTAIKARHINFIMYLECIHNLESKNVIIAFSSHISYCKLKVVKKVEMVSHLIIAYISV